MDETFKEPVVLNAYQLRWLAEAASSARGPDGDPYYLVEMPDPQDPDTNTLTLVHGDPKAQILPFGIVMEIDTRDQQPRRPRVENVIIEAGGQPFELAHKYDAVFWSESAVEKFLFPYYASKSMWRAAAVLSHLSRVWYRPLRGSRLTGSEEDYIPFAVAHVPDSDFVPLFDGSGQDTGIPGHDLHLLFRKRDGTVHARSLAELIAEEEAESRGTAGPATQTPASPDVA